MPLELPENHFLEPTPVGAYQSLSDRGSNPVRRFLRRLLGCPRSPALNLSTLMDLTGLEGEEAVRLLRLAQEAGWVQALPTQRSAPEGPVDTILPGLLPGLSSSGCVLLADPQGFYVAATGFPHESAEELAALSASLGDVYERNRGLLQGNLRLGSAAWAIVDSAGNSRIGFWPLYLGPLRFVLVIGEMPRLNQPQSIDLLWTLCLRYGEPER